MFKENFSNHDLEEARRNGFILTGKTGAGKSTLLNVIFGKEVAIAKQCSFAVTTEPEIYFYRLKNGKCISLVDTPGLSDPSIICKNKEDLDNIHLKEIEEKISKEKINIKGILFLVNFQEERFDQSEQEALLNYNALFPLKRFWKHLIVIFTHSHYDPDGYSIEEMKESRDESNGIIFSGLMEKIKNVSDVINYKELRMEYYSSYSPVKTEKQKIKNEKNRDSLEKIFDEMIGKEPLFCQIEILRRSNEKEIENDETYLVDYDLILYYDLNNIPIKQQKYYIKKELINEQNFKEIPSPDEKVISLTKAEKDPKGKLVHVTIENPKDSKTSKILSISGGGLVGAGIGALGGLAYAGAGLIAETSIGAAIAAGIGAGASVFAAPVAIGVGAIGVAGAGIGYLISKLFN